MGYDAMTRKHTVLPSRSTQTDPFLSLGSPSGAPLDLPVGTRLDRFCVREKLGHGSLGEVYRAHDTVTGCDVAIKVASVTSPESDGPALLLKHEKAMYDKVQHNEHVLKANDLFPAQYGGIDLLVLSMELADGGTLSDWLDTYRHEWATRRRLGGSLIRQVCLGVMALHEVGVRHLDLKPSNFLFVNGVLKVGDLGASVFGGVGDLPLALRCQAFKYTVEVGTACYNSPEHFTAGPEDLDERSDIYSLGNVIYEILSPKGHPPFQGGCQRLRQLHTSVPAPALEGATDVEAHVVRRCLEKDPAKRHQTVRDLLDDLEGRAGPCQEMQSESQVEVLWADACASLEQGQLSCARALCGRLLKLDPDHEGAQEMSRQLDERFDRAAGIYSTIDSKMDLSGLEELITLAVMAAELYPDHPAASAVLIQLETKATRYSHSMEEGLQAMTRSDWQIARDRFEKAQRDDPGSVAAERAVRFAVGILDQIQESRQLMDLTVENGAFAQARQLADELDEYLLARREEAVSFLAGAGRARQAISAGSRVSATTPRARPHHSGTGGMDRAGRYPEGGCIDEAEDGRHDRA